MFQGINKLVYLDSQATNASLHIIETSNLLDLVREVLANSELFGEKVAIEKDLGRTIGQTSLIETNEGDEMPKSQCFWANHALVYDESIIQPGTITSICPWS